MWRAWSGRRPSSASSATRCCTTHASASAPSLEHVRDALLGVCRCLHYANARRAVEALPRELVEAEAGSREEKIEGDEALPLPLSELSSGEEINSLDGFSTPVLSPKLLKSDDDDFGSAGFGSPGSPPPFAVAARHAIGGATSTPVGSPFRWEKLAEDPSYGAPVLKSPPSGLRAKPSFHGPFGLQDEDARGNYSLSSSPLLSPNIVLSPRALQRAQVRCKESVDIRRPADYVLVCAQEPGVKLDANYTNPILTHAFKGMTMGTPPLGSPPVYSPRLGRKISSSGTCCSFLGMAICTTHSIVCVCVCV